MAAVEEEEGSSKDAAAPAPTASGPDEDVAAPAATARPRIAEARFVGLVVEWRGYMGWIQPLVKVEHEQATKHQGRIYLNVKDIVQPPTRTRGSRVKEGKVVDFFIYTDNDGLGAEECRPRTVLRMTLAHSEAKGLKLGPKYSQYLPSSEYYPTFERDNGVLLRKYTWQLPFALMELWGHHDELARAAAKLASRKDAEGQTSETEEECSLRILLPEADVSKVESLPGSLKVSSHNVVVDPQPCRSMMVQASQEKCQELVKDFLELMSRPTAAGA